MWWKRKLEFRRRNAISELAKGEEFDQHASVSMAIKRYENEVKRRPGEQKLLKQAAELLQITGVLLKQPFQS